MNNTFVEEIRNAVAKALDGKIVEVREVEKTNGVIYTGISIRTEGCNIAPTIYLDEGQSVEMNVKGILEAYAKCQPREDIELDWMEDYEQVKNKLSVMITSKPISGLAKRKAPGFDDLYMHAYVLVDNLQLGKGTIKVREELMKTWGVSNAKLFADALKSAPTVTPVRQRSMFQTMVDMGAPEDMMMAFSDDPMQVVSNKEGMLGAATILYTKVTEGTYMIPSSVHEVLLLDGNRMPDVMLNEIIGEVNREAVAPQDYLSNHAYRYNGKKWENVV